MVSGFKKSKKKKKEKFVLAKDKKQAQLAIIVLIIFVVNSVYTAVKIYKENNPTVSSSQQVAQDQDNQLLSPGGTQTQDPTMQGVQPSQDPQDPSALQTSQAEQPSQATSDDVAQDANDIYFQTIGAKNKGAKGNLSQVPEPDSGIEIMTKKIKPNRYGKMVMIPVDSSESSNPFYPGKDNVSAPIKAISLPYLTAPPDNVLTNSEAGKVMETTISGILYDKYSPSAIINIEGSDYLVKRGDVINHYKILFIGKTQVIVQLGKNIYKAGVGELLSPADLNYNTIANLNKKFGGNNIQINVKKKGY